MTNFKPGDRVYLRGYDPTRAGNRGTVLPGECDEGFVMVQYDSGAGNGPNGIRQYCLALALLDDDDDDKRFDPQLKSAAQTAGALPEYNALMRRLKKPLVTRSVTFALSFEVPYGDSLDDLEVRILQRLKKISNEIRVDIRDES